MLMVSYLKSEKPIWQWMVILMFKVFEAYTVYVQGYLKVDNLAEFSITYMTLQIFLMFIWSSSYYI